MDASVLAGRFGLGRALQLSDGPVARGKEGLVWRLETVGGSWAVEVPFDRSGEEEVGAATAFQEAAYAVGVPTPQVRRTVEGRVFATIGGEQVRVYGWVDLLPPDRWLDAALVGAAVAAIHRVGPTDTGPLDPWYHEPLGAARWDYLVQQLREAGAPFAGRLADLRDELVALESWIEPPQLPRTCHRDLWADNVLPTTTGGVRRGHFSMLIAQLGHINETAATDWLTPNPRSPQRADAAAWIGETLDDPHTRERLEFILAAASEPPRDSLRTITPVSP